MTACQEYLAAVQDAETKKASFLANAQIARARVSPSRLKNDTKTKLCDAVIAGRKKTTETVQTHPVAVGLAGAGIVAFLFRRPLYKLALRIRNRVNRPKNELAVRGSLWDRFDDIGGALSKTIRDIRNEK